MRCAKENHTTQKIAGGNANTARDLDTKQNSADITQKHKTLDEPPRIEKGIKNKKQQSHLLNQKQYRKPQNRKLNWKHKKKRIKCNTKRHE